MVCILIGRFTFRSKWIDYEIREAYNAKKGIFGIYIHRLKDQKGNTSIKGENPLTKFDYYGRKLSNIYNTYDPISYYDIKRNMKDWIENAYINSVK